MEKSRKVIQREKTAIRRKDFSVPIKCARKDGLLDHSETFFDFGCGHGEDIKLLNEMGVICAGWDPVFEPKNPIQHADVVNLGYVINVIEDPKERTETLKKAWSLCRKILIVSALIKIPARGKQHSHFGDGFLTKRGTFQKYYEQGELKEYLETTLGMEAIPATVGVFYIFKDEIVSQEFQANRCKRHSTQPRLRISEQTYESNKELLDLLMKKISLLGRIPGPEEFEQTEELIGKLGSIKKAFLVIRRITKADEWDEIGKKRTEDLLVFLALARFGKRPTFFQLSKTLQRDIKAFFGSYKSACLHADKLLFQAGDADSVNQACQQSPIGKLLPNALYVHRSALKQLSPLLRVYEGCGRNYLGDIEDANIIKIHRHSGKLSYLCYPNFEKDPHPTLFRSVKLTLRGCRLDCFDYSSIENPPILHRKETLLAFEHPFYDKFSKLTQQEEQYGLLDNASEIGTRLKWEERLNAMGYRHQGHRLVRKKLKGDQNKSK